MLAKGGTEVVKLPQTDTGLLSNSKMVIWPYTKLNDSRVTYLTKYILLKQDENAKTPFKLGFDLEEAKILYFNKNCLFIKK